jgi:lipid-A-disaccharide synthase-like uncharacterized protein
LITQRSAAENEHGVQGRGVQMLVDIAGAAWAYLLDVFVVRFDWWVALGFTAQLLFGSRFFVQWIASERAGRSVVPLAFWLLSASGGSLMVIYALYRRDPVFILGQSLGMFIYLRNLQLVLRERRIKTLPPTNYYT